MPDNGSQPGYMRSDTHLATLRPGGGTPRPERAGSIIGPDNVRTGLFAAGEVRPPGEQTAGPHRPAGKTCAASP